LVTILVEITIYPVEFIIYVILFNMTDKLDLNYVEIEDQVLVNAITSLLQTNKDALKAVKELVFQGSEVVDLRKNKK
jgi:hypothetical protein